MIPPYGLTIQAEFVDNYDGDSITIQFNQTAKIRVTNEEGKLDTPELGWRAKSDAEAYLAELAKEATESFCNDGPLRVYVPAGRLGIFGDSTAVGNRYAARIWNDQDVELADHLENLELTKGFANILTMMDTCDKVIHLESCQDHIDKAKVIYLPSELSNVLYTANQLRLNSLNKGGNFYKYLDYQFNFNDLNICFVDCGNSHHNYIGVFDAS